MSKLAIDSQLPNKTAKLVEPTNRLSDKVEQGRGIHGEPYEQRCESEAGLPDEAAVLRDAIHEFFTQRSQAYGRRLRELFRVGRTSLVIGLVALTSAIALGDFLAALMKGSRIGEIVRESLTIGGWDQSSRNCHIQSH